MPTLRETANHRAMVASSRETTSSAPLEDTQGLNLKNATAESTFKPMDAKQRFEPLVPMVEEYELPDYWTHSRLPPWLQSFLTQAFVFVAVHYTFWCVPVGAMVYFLIHQGSSYTWSVVVVLGLAYLPSFCDGSQSTAHGKQWELFRSLRVWNLVAGSYLKMKILRETTMQADPIHNAPQKKYVFGYHPHGVLVLSRFALAAGNWQNVFPRVDFRFLGASAIFRVPFCRDASLWLGAVDASRATAEKVISSGKSVKIYPGGIAEMFVTGHHQSKETVLILHKRLGFIKLAMRNGADLVPVFVFNEKYLYNVWTPPAHISAMVHKTLRIPLIAFWGRFLWMPLEPPADKRFGVVYGTPIAVTQDDNPSEEAVRALHNQYVKELERLFHQYKGSFGCDDDETLVIQ